jgi:hypothetical protein
MWTVFFWLTAIICALCSYNGYKRSLDRDSFWINVRDARSQMWSFGIGAWLAVAIALACAYWS